MQTEIDSDEIIQNALIDTKQEILGTVNDEMNVIKVQLQGLILQLTFKTSRLKDQLVRLKNQNVKKTKKINQLKETMQQ